MPRTFLFLIFWAIYWPALRPVSAERLSPLSSAPDWQDLGVFQQTITHDEFKQLLAGVYAPNVDLAHFPGSKSRSIQDTWGVLGPRWKNVGSRSMIPNLSLRET